MSYPVGWDLVNITGTYIGRNGVPCVGSVTLSSPQMVLRSGTIVPAADIVFDLVNGTFSGQIPATDDPNASPTGWVYTVTENVPGGRQGFQIVAPHTSPGIDLSTVVPVTMPMPPTSGFPYVTLSQLAATTVGQGAALVGYIQSGIGAIARTVLAKLREWVSLGDFGSTNITDMTTAVTAVQTSGGGTLRLTNGQENTPVPGKYWSGVLQPGNFYGVTINYDGPNVPTSMFLEQYGTSYQAQKVLRYEGNTAHAGIGQSVLHIENTAYGTGNIGSTNADFGLSINLIKANANGVGANSGELDGIYIGVRNDGANSDTTGLLIDVGQYDVGFNAAFEANTTTFTGGVAVYQMDVQCGVVDTRTGYQYGLVLNAEKGNMSHGILINSLSGANWTNFLVCAYNQINTYTVSNDGVVHVITQDGTKNLEYGIDPSTGAFFITVNSGSPLRVLAMDQSGNLSIGGWINVGGTEILGTTATTATAGTQTLPANPVGFMEINIGGTVYKIPYYNN